MAKVDIKLGTTFIPMYDECPETLHSFIDAIEQFNSITNDEFASATQEQKHMVENIIWRLVKTRLSGTVRQIVNDNQNLQEIITTLKQHCVSTVTTDQIISNFKSIQSKGNVAELCDNICDNKITIQLRSLYITENIPVETANRMATKAGI